MPEKLRNHRTVLNPDVVWISTPTVFRSLKSDLSTEVRSSSISEETSAKKSPVPAALLCYEAVV